MKRRMLSFIVALTLCLNLCPVQAFAAGDGTDGGLDDSGSSDGGFVLTENVSRSDPVTASSLLKVDTNGYTFTGTGTTVIRVVEGGKLHLTGTINAPNGIGLEIQPGGFLSVTGPNTSITGKTYALDIASGAEVHLSAGTYSGRAAAIRTADGDFAALLAQGCAYFDGNGSLLPPTDAVKARILTVGPCTGHSGEKTWTHTSGATEHTWTCPYCSTVETEKCTFTFDQDGNGTCGSCENAITVAVNEDSLTNLVYDGTLKPGSAPPITVTLTGGTTLTEGANYEVKYDPRTDAGDITVTVTGVTFNGTFTKTYHVERDQPGLSWNTTAKPVPISVDYDGSPVEAGDLPPVIVNIQSNVDNLQQYLQYSYKKAGDATYTDGLPTNAGTYDVVVSLPEMPNFHAVTSESVTLIINKISAVTTAPTAKTLTYNREAQELVTAGVLEPGAVAEGAKIEFKLGTDGTYSTDIPTGIGVSSYNVYYCVAANMENYTGVSETLVANPDTKYSSARINHKELTPTVELEYNTTLYTGGDKEPKVTVKDGEYEIPISEYTVAYKDNRNVGTATVTVTNADKGNYKIIETTAKFKITSKEQATLSITNKPNTVTYGDEFTLSTVGGSGNGLVTWEVVSGQATINATSGRVKITGHGDITIKATKSGKDTSSTPNVTNYEDATDTWQFTADLKPVTATVTAEDKFYGETYGEDGSLDAAKVHAVVEQGVLPGDEITITGLTGAFSDGNAGEDKTVTVDKSGASITGKNSEHYDVAYSSLSVRAAIKKAVVHITTAPNAANLTYDGSAHALIDDYVLVVDVAGVQVEYALSENGTYSTTIPEGTNAGAYTVWYRVKETDNYTGLAPAKIDVTIAPKPVLPTIELGGDGLNDEGSGSFYIYDGNAKEPTVALTEADGTTPIPADQYTVSYNNNVNVGTTATVTVTAKADGNYEFTPVTAAFEIKKEQAKVLTAPEAAGDPLTFNTYAQKLVTAGTGAGGKMVYSLTREETEDKPYLETIPTGTDAKDYTVYYKVAGDGNHSDSDVGEVPVTVTIAPKTVNNPTIELQDDMGNPLVNYIYDGNAKEPKVIVKDGSTVIGTNDAGTGENNEYNVVYSDNRDAGKGTVNITDKPGGNYTVTGSATFVIQKADIVFNPAPSAAVITYDGALHELLVPGTTSGGEVLYALNSPTSTYSAAIPQGSQAGDYTVYYKVIGDKNHNDLAVQSVPVTIQRKPLTAITIELSAESFAYDGSVKLPEVKVWDGKTLLPEGEYTWSCDVEAPTDVGTYTITIKDKKNGNYDLTTLVPPANEKTFTIGQIPQEALVIGGKPAVTNYGDTFKLTISGGSGDGEVTWRENGPAMVDNDGNVTINDVGEVTITVEKAADTNYLAAKAEWTFTAAPKPVTASVAVADKEYDGRTDATVTSASITTIYNDEVTINPASIIAVFDTPAIGTGKTVTLNTSNVQVTGDDVAKYAIRYPDTVTANIAQATTTITKFPEGITSLTYNGQPQVLVKAGEINVGFIVYSLDENGPYSTEIPTGTNAGTYNIYYKVDGTADYTGVTVNGEPVTVTIAPKSITPVIELSESSYLYDGTKKNPKITVKDGETVIDEKQYKVTWAGTKDQTDDKMLTVADTYTATIENVDGGNYAFTATAQVEIVAAVQDALKITGKPSRVYYGDTITTLDTTGGTGTGTVKWALSDETNSEIDETTGVLTVKDTGTLTVTAERAVPNYAPVSDTWTFTVEPKPVTAEVTIASKVYDGTRNIADEDITATVKTDVMSGDSINITGLKGEYDNANVSDGKTVTLDCPDPGFSITGDTDKYAVSVPTTAQGKITPRPVTVDVTLSDHDLHTDAGGDFYTFDGTEKKPAVMVTGSDETGHSATLTSNDYTADYTNNKNVGTADVTITAKEGGNYTFTAEPVHFEIRKGAAVLTTPPQAKALTYDGTDQDLVTMGSATGGKVLYSLTGADNSYSESIPQGQNAGLYTVYYKVVGDDNHDSTASGRVSVTIKPKEITPKITLSQTSYVYSGGECEPSVTVADGETTIAGPEEEKPEYTVSYRDNTNAGTATVIVSNANGGNYIVNGTATFTIDKAAVSVGTDPTAKENLPYNGTAQALVEAGKASGGTMVYSLKEDGEYSPVIPTGTAVGDYTVWYKVQGDDNHNDTVPASVDASIVVNEVKNPTIQVTPEEVTFNGKKQEPTVTVKDDNGLVIDGSEYTVTYADSDGKAVAELTNVGTYTLNIASKENGNYTFTFTNKPTFKILPADQTPLTITGQREHVYYGDTIQLGTSGGNGTVTWKVEDSTPASIAGGLLTISGVGSVTVAATSKDSNYTDRTATWSFYAEKKPVTAVVTAESKTYDGEKDATVTATLQNSDLVTGDTVKITLSGKFEDANAGTNKKVTVDSTDPKFDGSTGNYENYSISYPATTTASIWKAGIETEDVTPPMAKTDLEYTSLALVLVTPGSSTKGTLEYSTDNITYSASLPTGTNAGGYDVWYRVKGDQNHNDTTGTKLENSVTIAQQAVTDPIIEFTPDGASYDGAVHKPTVTVKDNNGRIIPDSEYTATYGDGNWKDVGTYKVTITDAKENDGNYKITKTEAEFEILMMGQSPLTITNQPSRTIYYGDAFTLNATGGSGTGTIKWEKTGPADIDQSGNVKVTGSGSVTITATKQPDGNYSATTATWTFSAEKKPVKAIVTADDKVYDGQTPATATIHITWKDGDLVGTDTIDLEAVLTGTFNNASVGDNKTVTITGEVPDSNKYAISYNTTTTASITPAAAKVTGVTAIQPLTYTGQPQPLVNEGSATNGTILYSLDDIIYSRNVPEGTNAGTYTVWYKVTGDENYKDVAPAAVRVTIEPKTVSSPVIELSPEIFDYDGTAKKPDVVVKDGSIVIPAGEYTVGYSNNVNAGTNATVTISDVSGGNYTVSGSTTFTIRAGVASLKDEPKPNNLTYNGFAQELLTPGTAVNGRVVYSTSQNGTYSTSIPMETNAGTYQVWYKVEDENGTEVTTPRSKTVTIQPKQVTPIVLVNGGYNYSTTYTGSAVTPPLTVIVDSKPLNAGEYLPTYSNNDKPGTATVTVQNLGGNYQFFAVATFEITKAKATFSAEPEGKTGLVYTGEAQDLVEWGMGNDGMAVIYSLNGGSFYPFVPTATEVGSYVVSAKVQGNDFYADSDVKSYRVTIGRNTIAEDKLDVTLSANSLTYTGSELKPTVTVRDVENNVIISASEYSVTYSNNINVGQADVTVTSTTKNYSFSRTVHFQITDGAKPALTITGQPDTVYYGDTLRLSTTGGSGTVTWTVENGNATAEGNGRFKITSSGSIMVKATDSGGDSDTWTFYADPKPVTAIVTAADKPYDNGTSATLTVIVNSGLAPGDTAITTVTAEGQFMDANVGTDKTVIITKWTVPEEISKKYAISYPATTTASITPAAASVTNPPQGVTQPLTYTGSAQPLVEAGVASNGNMMYSLDGINYSYDIPTGTDAKTYTVWYKVVATDENHKDSAPVRMAETVTIAPNTVTPTVKCVPDIFQFDGTPKTPTVVVRDSDQRIIPEDEYTVEIPSATAVNIYTVTVTDKPDGNYKFDSPVTETFNIVASSQNPLSIITDKSTVNYGDSFRLSAMGGSGSGAIQWSIKETDAPATIDGNGVVTVNGVGGFTVEAYREAYGGYDKSNTASVPFYANPKPVTAVAMAVSRGYNAKKDTAVTVTVPELNATITAAGTFADENVGTNKTVTIVYGEGTKVTNPNYQITWPDTTTASIYKVDAKIENSPEAVPDLTYKKDEEQALVIGGSTVGNIGTIVYSTSQNGAYSETIPTGTNAGPYTVWYKVADSVNYTGVPAAEVKVEIKKADPNVTSNPTASGQERKLLSEIPLNGGEASVDGKKVDGKFAWENDSLTVEAGKFYNVIFTPGDTANYNTVTIQIQVTEAAQQNPSGGEVAGPSYTPPANTPNTPTQAQTTTTVRNGTASTVMSAADGNKLVQEAVANQSRNVVIKPEITGSVTKSAVSIPSSTVSQLGSRTDAALTVSSPVADVTIPNRALDTLSQAGGAVSVVTEQVEQSVALTLTAGGKTAEEVPGGVTLTVPVEDAGPGTVAVLVHDDGTRETVRKSVVGDGVMSIPLSGSATVEIVDNSKDFTDVPPESWEADAVDFASSHELFSGTSETTFSPDLAMSRGMLATVLYRLEGSPEMDLTDAFRDVSDDAWYAEGVAWAAENGIADGYGDGQFGPDDNITREQFVVMLWRYVGSPKAGSQALDFTDADQISSFAREALCWAVENGILHGVGNGMLDPGGMATRAQAAQLLKNFMEST